jgi:asparaginyl-tRNA synthetase
MTLVSVSEVLSGKDEGEEVTVRGWLHHRRSSGGILFLQLRDGTGIIQCTLKREKVGSDKFERLEKAPVESTLEVTGSVRKDPRAPRGCEIQASHYVILTEALPDYPIAKKYHGPDFLLDHRHLTIRDTKMQSMLRIRARLLEVARDWLKSEGYLEVQVPIIVTAAVEGGSTLFELKYFDQKAYLTQSWQLYAEAMISSVGKIYTFAPSFRAEKSRTRRHLTEYWHLELEAPWMDLDELMRVEERLVSHIAQQVAEQMPEELRLHGRDPDYLKRVKPPFQRITYDEAIRKLQSRKIAIKWGDDLGWDQEKVLAGMFDSPFFVSHYPKGVKAFYHMPDPSRPEVTLSTDLLAPEGYGEITGGGQRIHDLKQILARIKEDRLDTKAYDWYIDLRRYGTVPHSGFGMGLERTVAWLCKLKHIRDAIAFPRLINRAYP